MKPSRRFLVLLPASPACFLLERLLGPVECTDIFVGLPMQLLYEFMDCNIMEHLPAVLGVADAIVAIVVHERNSKMCPPPDGFMFGACKGMWRMHAD